jgi:hypothetical protein
MLGYPVYALRPQMRAGERDGEVSELRWVPERDAGYGPALEAAPREPGARPL